MKKLVLYVFLSLIFFTSSYANNAFKGVYTMDLVVEKIKNKTCNVTKEDIEREVKFILVNTPIKLKKDISIEAIYIAPTIVNVGSRCSGYVHFEIWYGGFMKNSVGNEYFGKQILYDKGRLLSSGMSSFKNSYLDIVRDLTKAFVIKWREDN